MSVEDASLIILAGVCLIQQVFWAGVVRNLLNHLHPIPHFKQKRGKLSMRPENKADDYMIDPEDERQARELNSILQMK